MSFSSHFGNLVFWVFLATKLPKYYEIVCLLSLLSKARQTKRNSRNQNDAKTRNEATKISNELGKNQSFSRSLAKKKRVDQRQM